MENNDIIPSLAMFTLLGVVLIALVGFILFKRKPANRHPMDKAGGDVIATVPVEKDAATPRTIRSTDELEAADHRPPSGSDLDRRL